jgi:CheY-like chemotaxis protein
MAAPLSSPAHGEGAAILLVDDKPEKLLALRTVLADLGEEIVEAASGRAALRELLAREFAVILLDVNMPLMDGFETAALIRQRRLSEHTPIIFITAFGDDTHVTRGYSLGAVDYIVAPVVPEVLKSKVSVFVDLFRKTAKVRAQAESLRKRADQLQRLTRASLAINDALSLEATLRVVARSACDLLGAREAVVSSLADDAGTLKRACVAGAGTTSEMTPEAYAARFGEAPLADAGSVFSDPERRTFSAALVRRDGSNLGRLHVVCDPPGSFDPADEALLVSLAQMAAIAIENALAADLREANRLKDEFLTTLSHELRTPLSAVLGWTTLLRGSPGDTKRLEHGLEVIERNTHSQIRMVEDLLDISRITHGKLRLSRRDADVFPLVETAVDAMRPSALAKGVALRFTTAPELRGATAVLGDPERLQQVFRNLLSNAVKFTRAGGHVDVTLERAGDGVVVAVRDDGAGISPSFIGSVFERFRQADGSSSRAHTGLGIGLAIVRHIVEAHGGEVFAESAGVDRGATFTVRLPALRRVPEAPRTDPASERVAEGDLAGLRILLVDDEADGRDATRAFLEALGAEVTSAASMAEALERLAPEHDVLVSDIGMPLGDGYELLARVRELPAERGGKIPALALTAYARPEDRRRALAAGFAAHLPKPGEPAALVSAIQALVRHGPARDVGNAAAAPRRARERILVVDDDRDALEAIRAVLESRGHPVDVAESGREALETARTSGATVALIDSRLPDMPGMAVARALRSGGAAPGMLLVAISGSSPWDSGERPSIFDAWLSKPLDVGRLEDLLSRRR